MKARKPHRSVRSAAKPDTGPRKRLRMDRVARRAKQSRNLLDEKFLNKSLESMEASNRARERQGLFDLFMASALDGLCQGQLPTPDRGKWLANIAAEIALEAMKARESFKPKVAALKVHELLPGDER